jgi:hypothetical protein
VPERSIECFEGKVKVSPLQDKENKSHDFLSHEASPPVTVVHVTATEDHRAPGDPMEITSGDVSEPVSHQEGKEDAEHKEVIWGLALYTGDLEPRCAPAFGSQFFMNNPYR